MHNRLFQLSTLVAIAFMVSCDDEVRPNPVGSSNVTISGAETGTLNYSQVDFRYLINVLGRSESTLSINIGRIGATTSVLSLVLSDTDNELGFEVDTMYIFQPDPNTTLFYNPAYFTADNSYSINPLTSEDNWIKLINILDNQIDGEFEVNLEDSEGQRIKLVGSFTAIGSTL